jgi:DNA polymerase-3 subunit delta'
MQFSQVIGQQEVKEKLVHMVQQNRLSHALLFLGKEGTGALSMARALAQYSICETVNGKKKKNSETAEPSLFGDTEPVADMQPADLSDSCGTCPSCLKASKLIHPDIHFSFPVIPKKSGDKPVSTDYITEWRQFMEKTPYGNSYDWLQFIDAENKQGNITATECNEIIRKMSLKAFEADYKILIMWMPELLGKEGNKLLKLIEEPPPDTVFIFVAENDALILPTILSRTQLVRMPPLQEADIAAALVQQENISATAARQVAAISEGNFREAQHQLTHADDDWETLLRDWLNAIARSGPAAQVKWIEETSKLGREKQKQFLQYFIHLLEHSLRLAALGAPAVSTPNDDFALRLNKLCTLEQQEAISKELDNAIYYIERNANPKLLFHALTIRLYHIISNNSIILMS